MKLRNERRLARKLFFAHIDRAEALLHAGGDVVGVAVLDHMSVGRDPRALWADREQSVAAIRRVAHALRVTR